MLPVDHSNVLMPAMAFDGVNYLVVWNSGAKISGVFFGRNGRIAGDAFLISDEKHTGDGITPGVTWTGTHYLVTWSSSTFGVGSGAVVTTSGSVTPFKFASTLQMPSVSAGPRDLVVYINYTDGLWAKVQGVFLDAAGEPFDIDKQFYDPLVMEPHVVSNGRDFLVTWMRQESFRRSKAMVARFDDRGRPIGTPFVAAASETLYGARAIPLFDGTGYRVVVSGDPAMPLFTARVDDATFACGCFGERVAIPIDFDLTNPPRAVAAAVSGDALAISYDRPFTDDAHYGSARRGFLRFVRTPPPPRRRAAG